MAQSCYRPYLNCTSVHNIELNNCEGKHLYRSCFSYARIKTNASALFCLVIVWRVLVAEMIEKHILIWLIWRLAGKSANVESRCETTAKNGASKTITIFPSEMKSRWLNAFTFRQSPSWFYILKQIKVYVNAWATAAKKASCSIILWPFSLMEKKHVYRFL